MARYRFAEGRQAAFAYFSLLRKVGRRRHDKPKAFAKGNDRANGATDSSFNRHSAPDGAAGRCGHRPLQSAFAAGGHIGPPLQGVCVNRKGRAMRAPTGYKMQQVRTACCISLYNITD